MKEPFMSDTIKRVYSNIEEIIRQEMEYKERTLAEIIKDNLLNSHIK